MSGSPELGELDRVSVTAPPQRRSPVYPRGTAPATRGSRLFKVSSSVAACALVAALAFEVTCRVEDWVMYRTPVDSPFRSIDDLTIRDSDGVHGRPNARFQRWVMNNLGTRGPDAAVVPAARTVRVITVGASETFGLRESPNREYPRQLEDSLNARVHQSACPSSSKRFEVLNAAFAGMSLPTIDQDVRNRLARLRPAIVAAYPSPVGYLVDVLTGPARPDSNPGRLGLSNALRPRARDRLRDAFKSMLPEFIKTRLREREIKGVVASHDASWRFTSVPNQRLTAFELDLRRLVGTIRSIGAEPVLATHANAFVGRPMVDADVMTAWQKFLPRATAPTILAFDSLARDVTLRVANDSSVAVVDATTRLAAEPPSAFADAVHFTDFGAAVMASTLTDGVLAAAQTSLDCPSR